MSPVCTGTLFLMLPKGLVLKHLGTLFYLELRICQELPQQKSWNVRSANDIYLQEWGDPSWNNGTARKSCPHTSIPESWVGMALVIGGF